MKKTKMTILCDSEEVQTIFEVIASPTVTVIVEGEVDIPLTTMDKIFMTSYSPSPRFNNRSPKTQVGHKRHVITGKNREDIVMEHFTPDGTFNLATLHKWLTEVGYSRSLSPATRLEDTGYIVKLSSGHWRFLKPLGGKFADVTATIKKV